METNNSNTSITYDIVYQLIENSLSNNTTTRTTSEQHLTSLINSNKTKLIQILFNILTQQTSSSSTHITQMTAVLIKNILLHNTTWFTFTTGFQKEIILSLYALIQRSSLNTEVNKHSCIILANIAYIEYKEGMNEKILNIMNNIIFPSNTDTQLKMNVCMLYTCQVFMEFIANVNQIPTEIIDTLLNKGLISIIINYEKIIHDNNTHNIITKEDQILFELAVGVYSMIIPFCNCYISKDSVNNSNNGIKEIVNIIKVYLDNKHISIFFSNIFHVNIIHKILLLLYNVFAYYYLNIPQQYIETIIHIYNTSITFISTYINTNTNLNNTIQTKLTLILNSFLEICCLISDKEFKTKTSITDYLNINIKQLTTTSLHLLEQNTKIIEIDHSTWNTSKSICYFISFLLNISIEPTPSELLLLYVTTHFNDSIELNRYISILVLSCCLESKHKEKIISILSLDINTLFIKLTEENNKVISNSIGWLLGKVSEVIPEIFKKETLYTLIPKLINGILNLEDHVCYSIEIRINLAMVFGNIIKYYGDEITQKYNNIFSPYYKLFLNRFINESVVEENIKTNLSFYLIRIIIMAIQYSSNDFQDSIEIYFTAIVDKLESVIVYNNNTNCVLYFNIEEYLCLVINHIFHKIRRDVNIELCKRIYKLIMTSFTKRKCVYESGMIVVFNIIVTLFQTNNILNQSDNILLRKLNNTNTLDQFNIEDSFTYILTCIHISPHINQPNSENERPLLMQSALLIITKLSSYKSPLIQAYCKDIIQCIIDIMVNPNIKHNTKLISLQCIGEICFNYHNVLELYIDQIVPLLFSAFDIVLHVPNHNEYSELILILTETFSLIITALNRSNKENLLYKYISTLISYINTFCKRDNISQVHKNKFVLLFGDVIELLGERIREYCNKEETYKLYKVLAYNADKQYTEWLEKGIKRIFG